MPAQAHTNCTASCARQPMPLSALPSTPFVTALPMSFSCPFIARLSIACCASAPALLARYMRACSCEQPSHSRSLSHGWSLAAGQDKRCAATNTERLPAACSMLLAAPDALAQVQPVLPRGGSAPYCSSRSSPAIMRRSSATVASCVASSCLSASSLTRCRAGREAGGVLRLRECHPPGRHECPLATFACASNSGAAENPPRNHSPFPPSPP